MKILLVTDGIPPDTLGGAGRIVVETAQELLRQGHDPLILTTGNSRQSIDGIRIIRLPKLPHQSAHWRAVFDIRRIAEIQKIITLEKPDIIHAHAVAWQMGYGFLRHLKNIPSVFTAHDAMTVAYGKVQGDESFLFPSNVRRGGSGYNPFRTTRIRQAMQSCTQRLCVSNALKIFLEEHGMPPLRTLYNGIDTVFWKPMDQSTARRDLDIPLNATVFLMAGRVGVNKGSALIAGIFPHDSILLIAGTMGAGEFKRIEKNVRFLGDCDVNRMRSAYAACDVVLVPSQYLDPFPTVCLEGMAMERPVIATNKGGAKEAVSDGITGWITDSRDENAWKARMDWCARNRHTLRTFGKAGRTHVEQSFSQKLHVAALLKIYGESGSFGL